MKNVCNIKQVLVGKLINRRFNPSKTRYRPRVLCGLPLHPYLQHAVL